MWVHINKMKNKHNNMMMKGERRSSLALPLGIAPDSWYIQLTTVTLFYFV